MTWRTAIWMLVLGTPAVLAGEQPPGPDPAGVQFFESKVRPLLIDHCQKCHGAEKQKASLRLDSVAALRKGGDTGPVVIPGKPAESLLIKALAHDGELKMPPNAKLKPEQIGYLTEWVKIGAPWPEPAGTQTVGHDIEKAKKEYWAFQPVRAPALPQVKDAAWPRNPVDHFILAKLEAKGLTPVGPAEKRDLLRRAAYDLTGLPPLPEEIEAFLADQSPEAFAKIVDRLLASPAYGERWGRHWLDVVRYADTAGDNSDYPVPQLYKYRNWVIDAFNRDLPYDEFVRQQLAGDLMPAANDADRKSQLVATGYLANTRRFGSYEDARYQWYLTYEDTIDNLGKSFLGLTVNCSRCHDHKFDPLTAEDYYALYGFFSSSRYPWPGIELDKAPRDLVPVAPVDVVHKVNQERQRQLAEFDATLKGLEGEKAAVDQALKDHKGGVPAFLDDLKKRSEELTKKTAAQKKERDLLAKTPPPYEVVYAMAEGKTEGKKKVGNACVQIKGDPERLGKEVPRRFPLVLGGQALPADAKGSGRLELARWITDPANPVFARLMVNRIWQYHFGRGIVPTPNDFGKQGKPPSHPELLDYLANHFMQSQPGEPGAQGEPGALATGAFGVKKMHRLIMLSRTYQLSSRDHEGNMKVDPANEFLWKFSRRRLDAESIRDTLLAVSGNLDRSAGGAHPFPEQTAWNFTQHNPFKAVYDSNRRSVYLMTQRIQRHPFLALFDGPDTNASTGARITSTTPLQALFLMNDPFTHEQARKLAERLRGERGEDGARIARAYLLLFGRPATAEEQSAARAYLAQARDRLRAAGVREADLAARAWESYVRVLFMANELVYVE